VVFFWDCLVATKEALVSIATQFYWLFYDLTLFLWRCVRAFPDLIHRTFILLFELTRDLVVNLWRLVLNLPTLLWDLYLGLVDMLVFFRHILWEVLQSFKRFIKEWLWWFGCKAGNGLGVIYAIAMMFVDGWVWLLKPILPTDHEQVTVLLLIVIPICIVMTNLAYKRLQQRIAKNEYLLPLNPKFHAK